MSESERYRPRDSLAAELGELRARIVNHETSALRRAEWMSRCLEIYRLINPGANRRAFVLAQCDALGPGFGPDRVERDLYIIRHLSAPEREAIRSTQLADKKAHLLLLARKRENEGAEPRALTSQDLAPLPRRNSKSNKPRAATLAMLERDEHIRLLLEQGKTGQEICFRLKIASTRVTEAKHRLGLMAKRGPLHRLTELAQEFADALRDQLALGESKWSRAEGDEIEAAQRALSELKANARTCIRRLDGLNKEARKESPNVQVFGSEDRNDHNRSALSARA